MNDLAGVSPRPSGVRRAIALLALTLLNGAACVAPARAAPPPVPAGQAVAVLLHDRVARTAPDAHARRIETVSARRPLTRVRTVLPVLGSAAGPDGARWLHVRLPGRPNGHKGWIPATQIRLESTAWHIVLDRSSRRVIVYLDGRVERRFGAVVGTDATPTPTGRFFIEEAVALRGQAGGPFALATSARSPVLQEFNGGPGQIALHGTDGLAGALGSAASHGCIRLSTRAIRWLARRIGGGVPLTIKR
jgi:lipoprotein-anchoring transpeptidase ErfK/SrfK